MKEGQKVRIRFNAVEIMIKNGFCLQQSSRRKVCDKIGVIWKIQHNNQEKMIVFVDVDGIKYGWYSDCIDNLERDVMLEIENSL